MHTSEEYSHAEGVIVQAVRIDLSEVLVLNEFTISYLGKWRSSTYLTRITNFWHGPLYFFEFKRDIHGNRVQINDPLNVDSDNDDDLDDGEWYAEARR